MSTAGSSDELAMNASERRSLAQNLALETIFMHSSRSERGPADPNGPSNVETHAEVFWDWAGPNNLIYVVRLEYEVADDEGVAKLSGAVEYVVAYSMTEGYKPPEEQLAAYSLHGVAFQVHPYLREHVADVCVRSGIAPAFIPILLREHAEIEYTSAGDGD